MSSSTKKTSSKKKMIITILSITTSVFLLTAFLSVGPSVFVSAIMQNHNLMGAWGGPGKSMTNNGSAMGGIIKNNIPQINGTINLKNSTNNISIGNSTVPFLTAAQAAQSATSNGKILNGHIGITQGYLTYNFAISNPTNNTLSKVIVDAGNGKVLYKSPGMSINSTQFTMKGMDGMTAMHKGFAHGGFAHGGFAHGGFAHGGFGHWGGIHHNNQGW